MARYWVTFPRLGTTARFSPELSRLVWSELIFNCLTRLMITIPQSAVLGSCNVVLTFKSVDKTLEMTFQTFCVVLSNGISSPPRILHKKIGKVSKIFSLCIS